MIEEDEMHQQEFVWILVKVHDEIDRQKIQERWVTEPDRSKEYLPKKMTVMICSYACESLEMVRENSRALVKYAPTPTMLKFEFFIHVFFLDE